MSITRVTKHDKIALVDKIIDEAGASWLAGSPELGNSPITLMLQREWGAERLAASQTLMGVLMVLPRVIDRAAAISPAFLMQVMEYYADLTEQAAKAVEEYMELVEKDIPAGQVS